MNDETRAALAKYLQAKMHDHLPGYYFDDEDVLIEINNFFKVADLIKQRDDIQAEIDKIANGKD